MRIFNVDNSIQRDALVRLSTGALARVQRTAGVEPTPVFKDLDRSSDEVRVFLKTISRVITDEVARDEYEGKRVRYFGRDEETVRRDDDRPLRPDAGHDHGLVLEGLSVLVADEDERFPGQAGVVRGIFGLLPAPVVEVVVGDHLGGQVPEVHFELVCSKLKQTHQKTFF